MGPSTLRGCSSLRAVRQSRGSGLRSKLPGPGTPNGSAAYGSNPTVIIRLIVDTDGHERVVKTWTAQGVVDGPQVP